MKLTAWTQCKATTGSDPGKGAFLGLFVISGLAF